MNLDSGTKCTLSKFVGYIHTGVVDTTEKKDAIQRDLDRFEKWAHVNLMKFSKA